MADAVFAETLAANSTEIVHHVEMATDITNHISLEAFMKES